MIPLTVHVCVLCVRYACPPNVVMMIGDTNQMGKMYEERLQEDGVDPAMITSSPQWPHHTEDTSLTCENNITATLATPTARMVSRTAPHPPTSTNTPEAKAEAAEPAATKKREDDPQIMSRFPPRAGIATSPLVPKGAYRRLLCIPSNVSWADATAERGSGDDTGLVSVLPQKLARDHAGGHAWTLTAGQAEHEQRATGDGSCTARGGGDDSDGGATGGDSVLLGGHSLSAGHQAQKEQEKKQLNTVRDDGGAMVVRGEVEGASLSADGAAVIRDVRLSFTLPPGSFATMCLRELMKQNFDIAESCRGGAVDAVAGAE